MASKKTDKVGLFKGVFMAYFILILHIILIIAIGCVVLFFRGVVDYMIWILAAGLIGIMISIFLLIKRFRDEKKGISDALNSPMFKGKNVEVSLLGGMAALRIGRPSQVAGPAIGHNTVRPGLQLEDPASMRVRELNDLARLFQKDLISREEYDKAKARLFETISAP